VYLLDEVQLISKVILYLKTQNKLCKIFSKDRMTSLNYLETCRISPDLGIPIYNETPK